MHAEQLLSRISQDLACGTIGIHNPSIRFRNKNSIHSAGDEWVVSIKSTVTTHHRVRVTKKDVERLAEGRPLEELLQESFRFLLEREPNTSILPSFDLPVIGRYFPEYEREIQTRLQRAH